MRVPGSIDTALRTIAALALLPGGIVVLSSAAIGIALLGGSDRAVHRAYLAFARLCLFVGGTDFEIQGRDQIRDGQAYVIVSNHESDWDPPSLIAALPDLLVRFIVKQQIMAIPIFGHALRLTGNVTVERNHAQRDVERIRQGMEERPHEVSMLFFAEGTRTRDGSLGAFKMGAFATAISNGLPILPVAIAGTRHIWPPGFVRVRKGKVVLAIGEPIPVKGLDRADRDRLRDQTCEAIAKMRAQSYARLRDEGYPTPPDV